MTVLAYCLSVLLMLLLPVCLAVILRRRFRVPWILFCAGTLTFIASQVVHFPLNNWLGDIGVLPQSGWGEELPRWRTALVLGLTAGLCEESARAVGYWLLRRYRRYQDGLMLGLGHGGIESMVFGGVLTAATVSSLLPLRGVDLQSLSLPADQLAALSQQLEMMSGLPFLAAILPFVERLIAMGAHVTFSLMVLQAFNRRNPLYMLGAIAYHAGVDASLIYLAAELPNVWVIQPVFLILTLPGVVWVWTQRAKAERERRQVPALGVELQLFLVALRKELLQLWRTRRVLVVVAVFLLIGLISPLLARFTPQLLSAIEGAEQFAELIPEPTLADAMAQYVKNLTQFGFIIAVLAGMGAVAGEKDKGTAAMVLSKPMPRWAFVSSKFVAQLMLYVIAFATGALSAYYYTLVLFGPVPRGAFAFMNLLLLLWLATFVAVTLLGSTLAKTVGAAAGVGLAGAVVLLLAGSLPVVGALAPGGLVTWVGQMGASLAGAEEAVVANGGAIAMSLVIVLMCLLTSVAVFERQEL